MPKRLRLALTQHAQKGNNGLVKRHSHKSRLARCCSDTSEVESARNLAPMRSREAHHGESGEVLPEATTFSACGPCAPRKNNFGTHQCCVNIFVVCVQSTSNWNDCVCPVCDGYMWVPYSTPCVLVPPEWEIVLGSGLLSILLTKLCRQIRRCARGRAKLHEVLP